MRSNLKFNQRYLNPSKALLLSLIPLVMFLITLVSPHKVNAAPLISNVAPVPSSGCVFGTNCSTTTNPWFAVGTGAFNGKFSYAKLYVPSNVTATLTIQQGGGTCGIDVGSPHVTYEVWNLTDREGFDSTGNFPSSGPWTSPPKVNTSFGCGSISIPLGPGIASKVPGHGSYKVYYFEADIAQALGDNEKNFRLSINNGSLIGVIAPVLDLGTDNQFAVYQRDSPGYTGISGSSCAEPGPSNNPNGCNWNWSVNYGPRCTDNSSPKTAQIYDIDWKVYNQPFLKASVMQDSRTDAGVNWTPAAPGGTNPTSRYQSQFVAGSHTYNPLSWTSDKDHRYGLFFQDIDWHNTIQITLPFDQIDGSSVVVCPTISAVCSASASPASPLKLNNGTTVSVKLTNAAGASPVPAGYEVRQVNNPSDPSSGPNGSVVSLSSNLAGGSSVSLNPFNISARASPQTINFYYALFNGSGTGAAAVGNNPLCRITIKWGTPTGGPNGNISVACGQTTISGVNLNDKYNPPAGASPTIPPRSLTPIKATRVPVRVHVTGNGVDFYYYPNNGAPNDGSSVSFNTYNMGDAAGATMWAHMSYHVELEVQGDSVNQSLSISYNNDGKWTDSAGATYFSPVSVVSSDDTPSDCLDATCGGATPADLEPGQSATFHYTVNIANNTSKQYNDNNGGGYSFSVSTSGGFANVGSASASPDPFGSGSVPVDVSFPARLDFTGNYAVFLNFQGSTLSLPSFSSCSGQETPATRPFFEIRAGDISTGGGFTTNRNGSDSCADTAAGDSPYISPSKTGYNYSGDIRAFSRPNQVIGSLSQFGAYSLGLTIGTIGGPIGFYSGDNALFANASSPAFSSIDNQGYAGYLNASPPAHCTPVDFFNSTRTSPSTPAFNGDLTNSPSGQYTTSSTTINGATIGVGKQITLYVDGDLTINGDIKYAPDWDPSNQANIPYLVLIVRGNITLTNNVRQLDGLYIAQPNGTTGGYFDTCDSSTYCPSGLTVNGAIIAQQVDLLRASGSMGPCDSASSTCNLIGNGPAEVVNYSPAMVIGLPNLLQSGAGAVVPSGVEGIFSLPPVF